MSQTPRHIRQLHSHDYRSQQQLPDGAGLVAAMLLRCVFFLLAAALTSLGTFSPAGVALLAPAALGLAYESRIHPVLMGAFVINGAQAGGFSPMSVAGVLVHDIALKNGFPASQGALFTASFALTSSSPR